MDPRSVGLTIAAGGVLLVVVGLVVASGGFSWFGRLPGDLRFGSGNVRVYIPFVSMLLVSLALSLLAALLRRL
jgi:hypothetical protein